MEREEKRIFSWALIWALILLLAFSCKKNDDTTIIEPVVVDKPNEEPEPENRPPGPFGLLQIVDGAQDIDLQPTLSWEQATDPDGNSVSYDLLLDNGTPPSIKIAENLSTTSFSLENRLLTSSEYYWQVIAKDDQGAKVESDIFSLVTRNINIPDTSPIWTELLKRTLHSTTVFNNELWVIGGGSRFESYAKSEDGVSWIQNMFDPEKGFSSAILHASVVFRDKLWVIGGTVGGSAAQNPVWFSDDGENWTEVSKDDPTSQFFRIGRNELSVVVFNDKMWALGGYYRDSEVGDGGADQPHNDIWVSEDGKSWNKVATNDEVFGKVGASFLVFDNKLWVIGGKEFFGNSDTANEVYFSEDGAIWEKVESTLKFSPRFYHASVVFDSQVFVIGGISGVDDLNAGIWSSKNAKDWFQISDSELLGRLQEHTATILKDKIMVLGGRSDMSYNKNVWILD